MGSKRRIYGKLWFPKGLPNGYANAVDLWQDKAMEVFYHNGVDIIDSRFVVSELVLNTTTDGIHYANGPVTKATMNIMLQAMCPESIMLS